MIVIEVPDSEKSAIVFSNLWHLSFRIIAGVFEDKADRNGKPDIALAQSLGSHIWFLLG
jgi:hypothetical protein